MSSEPNVDADTGLNGITVQLVLAEYHALRDEILSRAERQVQITTVAVLALGTLFAAGSQFHSASLVLIYPLVAAALMAGWAAEDMGIQAQGAYIWKVLEGDWKDVERERPERAYMRWEHFVAGHPALFRRRFRNAVRFFYALSESAAIILGLSLPQHSELVNAFLSGTFAPQAFMAEDVLLVLACVSLVVTLFLSFRLSPGSEEWRTSVTAHLKPITARSGQSRTPVTVPSSTLDTSHRED